MEILDDSTTQSGLVEDERLRSQIHITTAPAIGEACFFSFLRDFSLVFMEAPRVVAADFYIKNKCRPARPPRAARCAR